MQMTHFSATDYIKWQNKISLGSLDIFKPKRTNQTDLNVTITHYPNAFSSITLLFTVVRAAVPQSEVDMGSNILSI